MGESIAKGTVTVRGHCTFAWEPGEPGRIWIDMLRHCHACIAEVERYVAPSMNLVMAPVPAAGG